MEQITVHARFHTGHRQIGYPGKCRFVHGHTWKDDRPEVLGHRIGIDTGSYATGVLTALRLEDGSARVLQARLEPPAAS